jgi:hypothetical protein
MGDEVRGGCGGATGRRFFGAVGMISFWFASPDRLDVAGFLGAEAPAHIPVP